MDRSLNIKYWWQCQEIGKEIPTELANELEQNAHERIFEMIQEGYVSGELYANMQVDLPGRITPEDGWECSGWWNAEEVRA